MQTNVSLRFGANPKNPFGPIHKIRKRAYEKIVIKYRSISSLKANSRDNTFVSFVPYKSAKVFALSAVFL